MSAGGGAKGGARLLGAVLAGGAGRRFGSPKGRVRLGGRPLVGRAVEALRPWCERVVVVSARPVHDAGCAVVADRVEGAGPLGGLHAALLAARDDGLEGVVALACDLPLVPAAVVGRVAGALADRPAVAPARDGGGVEALCSAWSVAAIPAVEAALHGPDRSLQSLFRSVGGTALAPAELGCPDADAFLNVNTPADARRAEALLARSGP